MSNVEELLSEEKKRLDSITAPEELEMRLRSALDRTSPPRRKKIAPIWKIAAAALLLMVIVGNNYSAFAYYSKKIFGFDEVMSGTLQALNEDGMGQIVGKGMKLADGTDLMINAIMTDANQFIMYYTLSNPNGVEDSTSDLFSPTKITGFLTNSNLDSGTSIMNEDRTEIKGSMSFDPVSPFSKKLTIHFWQRQPNNQMMEERITFPYHPEDAMQTELKQSIRKTIKVDKGKITFASITATPTMTMIKGTLSVDNFDRVHGALESIQLIANGTPVKWIGSGHRSDIRGFSFNINYDSLPEKLDSLEIVMKDFVGYQKLNEKLSITTIQDEPFSLDDHTDRRLWVNKVTKTSEGVEVTIATDHDVMLDGVSVQSGNEITPLQTTLHQIVAKQTDGSLMKERTLLFDTTLEPEYLLIDGMHYMKEYNQKIELRVD